MANEEQLGRLKSSVRQWNEWREKNAETPVDLSGADLSRSNLSDADLFNANLIDTFLNDAILTQAKLGRADLSKAELIGANLSNANLIQANLSGTRLQQATLFEANLTGANLFQADLSRTFLADTVFGDLDLRTVIGLDRCFHSGPSIVDHRTLMKSGNLPVAFLRGCGFPDSLIEYLPSVLNAGPIQFYSCFISYSTQDEEFAYRLYADLQNSGVRCWFAPHDIQGGKKIHQQIDDAIRVYDKLLLILSSASMKSEWVNTEIAKARKREVHDKQRMLFPLRLVDFETLRDWEAFDADTGKDSAREIREYFIPDFSNWKTSYDAYAAALSRLLKDLKHDSGADS